MGDREYEFALICRVAQTGLMFAPDSGIPLPVWEVHVRVADSDRSFTFYSVVAESKEEAIKSIYPQVAEVLSRDADDLLN